MEIVRKIDDLNRQVFNFTWFDRTIILQDYRLEYKQTTRNKKWLVKNRYDRLYNKRNNSRCFRARSKRSQLQNMGGIQKIINILNYVR